MTGVRERIEAFIDWCRFRFWIEAMRDASNGARGLKAEIVVPRWCTADLHGIIFDYLGVQLCF